MILSLFLSDSLRSWCDDDGLELAGPRLKRLQCDQRLLAGPDFISNGLYDLLTSGRKARNYNINDHPGGIIGRTHQSILSASQGSYATPTEETGSWRVSAVTNIRVC